MAGCDLMCELVEFECIIIRNRLPSPTGRQSFATQEAFGLLDQMWLRSV